MSDPTTIFNEILNFLVTVFFATPSGGGLSMYQTLATTYVFSVSGNNCTLDNLNLTGVTTIATEGGCTPCTIYNVACYPFVGFMGKSTTCAGFGVQVTLGVLQGIGGLQLEQSNNPAIGSFNTTNNVCTITFPKCKIPSMTYSQGKYAPGLCAVACGDCNQGVGQQCGYTPAFNPFSQFQPFNAPVYTDITFNLQTIINSTTLGIDFSKSTITFNNMNIGFFPSFNIGINPYTFDIGNYLNQQLGIFVESKIPTTILQSLPNINIPTGILVDGKQYGRLSMRSPIHTFRNPPFNLLNSEIPYLFARDHEGNLITNFDRRTFAINIVNTYSPINNEYAKFFVNGNNVKSIENFSYY